MIANVSCNLLPVSSGQQQMSEMLAAMCQTMRRDIPEDCGLDIHYCENQSLTQNTVFLWAHEICDNCQILEHSLNIVSM